MNSPAADPPTPLEIDAFQDLLTGAFRRRESAAAALAMGLFPDQIIGFVRGDPGPRALIEASPWAIDRVVAFIKAKRDPSSLGARLLALHSKIDPHVWGVPDSGDPDLDLAFLLDLV